MNARDHPPVTQGAYCSGHCGTDHHATCRGAYAGTTCACLCHTPPPLPVALDSRHDGFVLYRQDDALLVVDEVMQETTEVPDSWDDDSLREMSAQTRRRSLAYEEVLAHRAAEGGAIS